MHLLVDSFPSGLWSYSSNTKRKRYDIDDLTHNTSTHTVIIRTHTHQEEQVGIYTLIQITQKSYVYSCTHRTQKRSTKKNILYLNLQRHYFDEIATLQKHYEYRDRSPYYRSRIEDKIENITHIWFMNGMKTHSRQMLVEFLGLEITYNKYILKLGKIVSQDISKIDKLVH